MSTAVDPQTSIWEKEIESDTLEEALEKREELKEPKRAAAKAYRDADDHVKALLAHEELGLDSVVRCGRFVVTRTLREGGKEVSFTTNSSERYQIKLLEEAG